MEEMSTELKIGKVKLEKHLFKDLSKIKEPHKTIIETVNKILPLSHNFSFYHNEYALDQMEKILNLNKSRPYLSAEFYIHFSLNYLGDQMLVGVRYFQTVNPPIKIETRVYFSSDKFKLQGYEGEAAVNENLETAMRKAYVKYVKYIQNICNKVWEYYEED